MSLTAILKQIKKVDEKHRNILQKYNSTNKQCPRHNQLLKEQHEDERIFGYSGSQILRLFSHGKKQNLDETRPCTAFPKNGQVSQKQERQFRLSDHDGRAKTAGKPVRYKEQFNFLFKEDIFGETCDHNRFSTPSIDKTRQYKLGKRLKRQGVPFSVRQQQFQSLEWEKSKFIQEFQNNLQLMQNREEQPTKKTSNKMTYQKKVEEVKERKKEKKEIPEDLFKLTRATMETCHKKIKVVFASSVDNLKELKTFMNHRQQNLFLKLDNLNKDPIPFARFEEELISLLPQQFTLTCIDIHSLQSLRLNLAIVNEELTLVETKQKIDLSHLKNSLVSGHSLVHMCFHHKEELLYQLLLSRERLTRITNIEHEIDLVSYYLKRFLLFDSVTSIQSVNESAHLMIKSNVDLPDPFLEYVGTFNKKMVHFLGPDHKYFTICLKTALLNGLRGVLGFKKEMGFGEKVVRIKKKTRRDLNKYTCNWAYFYICSFTISHQIYHKYQEFIIFFPFCPSC